MCRVSFFHTLYPTLANFSYPNPTLPYASLTLTLSYPTLPYVTLTLTLSYPISPYFIEILVAFNSEVHFGRLFTNLFSSSRVQHENYNSIKLFEGNHRQRYLHSKFLAFLFKTPPLTPNIRLSVMKHVGTPGD